MFPETLPGNTKRDQSGLPSAHPALETAQSRFQVQTQCPVTVRLDVCISLTHVPLTWGGNGGRDRFPSLGCRPLTWEMGHRDGSPSLGSRPLWEMGAGTFPLLGCSPLTLEALHPGGQGQFPSLLQPPHLIRWGLVPLTGLQSPHLGNGGRDSSHSLGCRPLPPGKWGQGQFPPH